MGAAFYRRLSESRFLSQSETIGPWSNDAQHGGPPCALLASAIDRASSAPDTSIAKLSIEFLRPVPMGELRVEVKPIRAGHKVALYEGILVNDDGPILLARAWRTRRSRDVVPSVSMSETGHADPTTVAVNQLDSFPYVSNIEWRFESGEFYAPGPALVHARVKIPLVEAEETSGLEALLILADSANGISQELDMREFIFVPVDLMCSLLRIPDPSGFITFDARTRISDEASGLSEMKISQTGRFIGSSLHTLYLEPIRKS